MKTRNVARAGLVVLVLSLLVLASSAPALAEATTEHFDATYTIVDQDIIYDCLGDGETIRINGTIHIQGQITYDANGVGHFFAEQNMQGVSGVGLTTGTTYQFIDSRPQDTSDHQFNLNGKETTFIINTRIIGQGPDNDLRDHETYHLGYNANGDLVVQLDHITFECP
jgi:hypothetical protein